MTAAKRVEGSKVGLDYVHFVSELVDGKLQETKIPRGTPSQSRLIPVNGQTLRIINHQLVMNAEKFSNTPRIPSQISNVVKDFAKSVPIISNS